MSGTVTNTSTIASVPEPTVGHPVFQTIDGKVYEIQMTPVTASPAGVTLSEAAMIGAEAVRATGVIPSSAQGAGATSPGVTLAHPGTISVSPTLASSGTVASPGTIAAAATTASAGVVAGEAAIPTSGMVYYVVPDRQTGMITQHGSMPATSQTPANLAAMGAVSVTPTQYMAAKAGQGRVAWVNGQVQPASATASITSARVAALAQINQGAQRAWGSLLSGGAPQLFEMMGALAEAQSVVAAPDPLVSSEYPWLQAYVAARTVASTIANAGTIAGTPAVSGTVAASGTLASGATVAPAPYTLRTAASETLSRNLAWTNFGVQIATVREAAIIAVKAATSSTAIQETLNAIKWPSPPTPAS